MNRILALLILVCAMWLVAPLAARAGYLISTIYSPDPKNNRGVDANCVSTSGLVVGDYYYGGGAGHGYTYNPQTATYTTI